MLLIAFFNWYYTFLQLEPKDLAEQLKRQVLSHHPKQSSGQLLYWKTFSTLCHPWRLHRLIQRSLVIVKNVLTCVHLLSATPSSAGSL